MKCWLIVKDAAEMKVLVLGATGLIGNGVAKHLLNTAHDVNYTYRNNNHIFSDSEKWIYFDAMDFSNDLNALVSGYDYVINCIGIIKPFISRNPIAERELNAVFPWRLASACQKTNAKMIHITTDCVFSGKDGLYNESAEHDATDAYGKSKSLGEPVSQCMVIRASMVGGEIHQFVSLMSWAKSQKGQVVKGFVNHLWNGITTKEYAIICQKIIENNWYQKGLFHIHASDVVSKFQMLEYFNEKYGLDLKVESFETKVPVDRSLSTVKDLCRQFALPTVHEMIMRY